jgi:IS30 family transposase
MGYTHLTMDERESIAPFLAAALSVSDIALALGRVPSTLYRELARNAPSAGRYSPSRAMAACQARREQSKRPWRLGDSYPNDRHE